MLMASRWEKLNSEIISCQKCPRLRTHCTIISQTKRKAYMDEDYWGQPVPNFGVASAKLLIVGLAPAAHGANRTGRMFTGDRSGDWLFRAMHKAGFANQAESSDRDDGLKLKKCAITAACHCAPPDNKPTSEEIANCREWFTQTVAITKPKVLLGLGLIGWNMILRYARDHKWFEGNLPKFGHGETFEFTDKKTTRWLVGSYHPSQQNTFTKRLTEPMFDSVFEKCNELLS